MNSKIKAYCRISTELQNDGVSLELQEMRISAYCVSQGFQLEKIYKEIYSAKDLNRPQLQLMLSELKIGDIVAVLDLSRLSRSTLDTLSLIKWFDENKIGFVCISQKIDTTSPEGRIMMIFISALNQFERENTARKVSSSMQALSQQGKLRSRPPFGWKFIGKDKDFVPDESQQQILQLIKQMHLSNYNPKQISDWLNSQGYNQCLINNKRNPEKFIGSLFHNTTIKKILVENGLIQELDDQKTIEKRITTQIDRQL